MFVNNAYPTPGMQPMGAAPTTAPSEPPKQGFFDKLKDHFSGMGIGFGPGSKEIKQLFKKADNNKDKALDASEIGGIGNALGAGPAAFGQADANANGKVSLGEFKKFIRNAVTSEFRAGDLNSDKKIDANEFQSAIAPRNPGLSMQGIDTSKDGAISFKEYLRFRVSTLMNAH
jgi:hypothetical protein